MGTWSGPGSAENWPALRTLTSATDADTEVHCLVSGHTAGDGGEGCSQEENSGFWALGAAFALFQLMWPLIVDEKEDKK